MRPLTDLTFSALYFLAGVRGWASSGAIGGGGGNPLGAAVGEGSGGPGFEAAVDGGSMGGGLGGAAAGAAASYYNLAQDTVDG